MAIKNLIQLRKGSASEWSSINPILASGEPGYDLTNNIIKVGDGATSWNNLSGIGSSSSSSSSVDLDTTLIAGTGIGFSYDSSNNSLYINITGQLGLSTEEVDDRVNALLNTGYGISLNYNDNANSLIISSTGLQPSGNYAASSHSHLVADVSGLQASLDSKQPSGSYAALSHSHNISDITGLQTALDDKQPSGSYASSSHTHISSNITDFNSSVSGLVSGVYAPLSGATFTGPISATSGVFSSGINITNGGGSIFSSGNNNVFLNTSGNVWFIGDGGGGNNVLVKYQNNTNGPIMQFRKWRGSLASPSGAIAGDNIGLLQFEAVNTDGAIPACARIQTLLESTPTSGTNVASQIRFSVASNSDAINAPSQRMVISSSGVAVNKSTPSSALDVAGLITSNSGNFTQSLQVNGTGVSISGHTHTASAIIDSTVAGRALLTASDAASQRTSLGLGTIATQASGSYALSSHTHTSSDITNFNSSVSGLLPVTSIVAGSGISVSSTAGVHTINARVYSVTIGNGSATSYTVTHNLSVSNDVHVSVRDTGTNYYVYPDVKYIDSNSCLIEFNSAPTTNQYRVSIIGF